MLIELSSIKKIYEIGTVTVPALNGVDVGVNQNEYVAIMGPSGSGKSTLLNVVSGLDNPTSGKIYYLDEEISKYNQKQFIARGIRGLMFVKMDRKKNAVAKYTKLLSSVHLNFKYKIIYFVLHCFGIRF